MGNIIKHQLGTGVTEYPSGGGSNTYTWGGRSFNPTENLSYGTYAIYPDIVGESYNYNLTGVNAGTETVLCLIVVQGPFSSLTLELLNPSGTVLESATYGSLSAGLWIGNWFGMGFRHGEIDVNGTYNYRLTIDGVQYNKTFTVNNITTQLTRHTSGFFWVEGDKLAYIDGCNALSGSQIGYKHLIDNDGTSYSTGKTPGFIRIPTSGHGKIAYIDSSGVERRTRQADNIGVPYDGGNLPQSGKTPGFIWVPNEGQFHWTYLFFVGNDGNVYRISHGNPFGY